MEDNTLQLLKESGISENSIVALAQSLSKIEAYIPTKYVNDDSPDLDADNLNHAEQGIKRVTDALNLAIDAITALNSDLANHKWKHYDSTAQLGLSDTSTITFDQILTAMTNYSILEFAAFKSDYPALNLPGSGQKHKIKVVYPLAGYVYLEDIDLSNNVIYTNRHDGSNYSGWSAFSCNPMSMLTDCNLTSANASGIYYFSPDTANIPIPTTYGMLKHYVTCGGAWLFQEATLVNNQLYIRSSIDGGSWSAWEEK